MDPWVITPPERAKHAEHFKGLNPVGGIVTGTQAKGFLMQSQLPPLILAQIWGLADCDKDGSLNFNEFSIACKLITMKLKGLELPKVLPPVLASTVMSPMAAGSPGVPAAPMASYQQRNSLTSPVLSQVPMSGAVPVLPMAPSAVPVVPMVPLSSAAPSMVPPLNSAPLMSGMAPMSGMPTIPGAVIPTVPGAVIPTSLPQQLSRKTSISSQDSSPVVDWPVPQPSRLKYTQVFNQVDRSKTGFMTAMQARQLLVQTGLNQTVLAKVWSLADIDGDGRLTCEEFILAMHLTDMVKRGEQLPVKLTPELVPPTFRRIQQQQIRRMSGAAAGITGNEIGTPPLNSVEGFGTPNATLEDDLSMRMPGLGTDIMSQDGFEDPATFEDKRKENFDKGQAVLERKRKMLQEQQQREMEERQRKEREEMERQERIRLEMEAKKQAELEKQLQRQKELEDAREEERKRVQEQRESARKEMERQRQLEWEKQRRTELLQQRQREQEKVVHLKAQSQRLSAELEQMDGKIKELTDKVADTRSAVITVKGTIDGMRETRDEKIDEMNKYKKLLMEHQQRMMVVVAEKAKLSERNRMNMSSLPDGNAMAATFAKKQAGIKQLKEKLEEYTADETEKLKELQAHSEQLAQAKTQLTELLHNNKNLITSFKEKRVKVIDLREKEKSERLRALLDPKAAWGDDSGPVDVGPPAEEAWAQPEATVMPDPGTLYRALYDFEARNPDELSFYAGDIVSITEAGSHEAGWFHGDLNGRSGWFPESYVELYTEDAFAEPPAAAPAAFEEPSFQTIDSTEPSHDAFGSDAFGTANTFEPISETKDAFNGMDSAPIQVNGSTFDSAALEPSVAYDANVVGYCVALYAYESTEPGDLMFQQGDTIRLLKDEGDWWTGYLDDPNHTGVFPANYVEKVDQPPKGKKLEVGKVIAPYQAASAEQLTLQRGQLVQIRKKSSSGWWEGELQAKGQKKQVGWFPGTYVKILVGSRSGSAASSTRTSPLPKEMFDLPPREQVIALFSYVAQNPDELSFEKGEQISIVSKDEPEWWKGELKSGESGLFPSNYVELLRGN